MQAIHAATGRLPDARRRPTGLARVVPTIALLLCCLVPSVGCSPVDVDSQPDRVRAVVLPFLTMAPFHIAAEEGYFADLDLAVEFIELPRIQELMAALSRGEVDAATGMLNIGILNSIAAGNRLRLVGALGYLMTDECSFHGWIARRDMVESGALEDPARIRELVFDANMLLPEAYWLDTWLRRTGVTIDDLELIDVPPAPTAEAVRSGGIHVGALPQPLLGMAAASDDLTIWQPSERMSPGHIVSVLAFGPTLLGERADVGERFATAVLRGVRRFQEGKTPENLGAVAEFTGLTADQVSGSCWPRTRRDARVDYASFLEYQEWAVGHGLLERVLTPQEVVDPRFMDAANARLDG